MTRPRRLVIDALQISPHFSGVGRELIEIGRDLARKPIGCELVVRCAADVAPRLSEAFPPETRFQTPIPSSRPRVRRILYQQLIAPLRDEADTTLVCIGDQAPAWGRARLVYVINDIRRITHPETAASSLEHWFYWVVIRAALRRASRVLTISEFSRSEIERVLAPRQQVSVININPRREPERVASASDEAGFLLVVGAIRRYKGIDTLIRAVGEIERRGERSPDLVVVGSSEGDAGLQTELHRQADELGVSARIRLTGWLPDSELESLYQRAMATVNPSSYEGFGLSVAESIARGLPTIASDIPAYRESAENAALLVPPGDAVALADAISRVASNPDLRRSMRIRSLERANALEGSGVSWSAAFTTAAGLRALPEEAGPDPPAIPTPPPPAEAIGTDPPRHPTRS